MAENEKNKNLEAQEKILEEHENGLTKAQKALIKEACEAYGIDQQYVLASNVRDGVAVVLTHGGSKVRYAKGDKVEPLNQVQVTGVNPALAKRKPLAGKKKE